MELVRALEPDGFQFALATMGPRPSYAQRDAARQHANLRLFESDFKLEWMDEPWEDVRAAGRWLLDLEERWRPDVVHLNGYVHAALPWRAPVIVAAHSCVLSWWQAVKGEAAPASWDRYRESVTAGVRAADMVIAPTRAILAETERLYGPCRAARAILNAARPADFRPGIKEPFILSAGRLWDDAKNLRLLDEAAEGLPWPVHVAGDCRHPDGSTVQPRAVHALGRLEPRELASWYACARVYALPAKYEPFGLSALEAALAGCALVLGDIPSLREVWGDSALFVRPDDAAGLRAALTLLMTDDVERARRAEQARARALAITPERMAAEYVRLYDEAVQSVRPTALV
jgi:glycosyltransferase involved in cell wall biosynthesis